MAERIDPVRQGLGQILGFRGQFVVVVGLIQLTSFSASRTAVHESSGHILLALLSGGAVHGGLGGVVVTIGIDFQADLVLVALLTERDCILFGQVQNIFAETVNGRIVPVADRIVTDVVVDLPVGDGVLLRARSSRRVFLNLDVSEVLGVPIVVFRQAHGCVKVDEGSILHFGR